MMVRQNTLTKWDYALKVVPSNAPLMVSSFMEQEKVKITLKYDHISNFDRDIVSDYIFH